MTKQEQIKHISTLLVEARTALEELHKEYDGRILDSNNKKDHYDLFVHYALRDIEEVENYVRGAQQALMKEQVQDAFTITPDMLGELRDKP